MNTQDIPIGELIAHPFQIHIPDMVGKEWTDFKADILERGVQDPLRVSNRTGSWVVVDGHQRLRAARQAGYTHLTALVQAFADGGEEVEYIAGSSRYRRNLTDAQRVRIGVAQEEYFAEFAKEAHRANGGDKRSEEAISATPNLGEPIEPRQNRTSLARASKAVGMKPETYRKGKKVIKEGSEQVKDDWEQGKVSTNAAYQITQAPKDIQDIMHADGLTSPEMAMVLKDPVMRAKVQAGEVRARVAADRLTAIKKAIDDELKNSGKKALFAVTAALDKFLNFSEEDFRDAAFADRDSSNLPDYLEKTAQQLLSLRAAVINGSSQSQVNEPMRGVA